MYIHRYFLMEFKGLLNFNVGSASIKDSNLILSCRQLVADVRGILMQEIFYETAVYHFFVRFLIQNKIKPIFLLIFVN